MTNMRVHKVTEMSPSGYLQPDSSDLRSSEWENVCKTLIITSQSFLLWSVIATLSLVKLE